MSAISGAVGLVGSEAVLILAACGLFLGAPFKVPGVRWRLAALAALGLAWYLLPAGTEAATSYAGAFKSDAGSTFFRSISVMVGLFMLLVSWGRFDERIQAEQLASVLLIIAGLGLTAAANDLIVLFLALELVSIPTYVLLYLPEKGNKADAPRRAEAAMKYFMLSVFSAAMFLYGASFLYGSVGSTNLEVIRAALREGADRSGTAVLLVALITLVAGLSFRLTAAPFHFYAPDVYEGAPPLTVTLLSVAAKLAGVAALDQLVLNGVLLSGLSAPPYVTKAAGLFWVLAVASMLVGNVLGLWQNNLRRLLAYSGIAHAGYMVIGLGAGGAADAAITGPSALFFYVPIYTLMTFGLFAAITLLDSPERRVETVDDLAGLGKSHPVVAFLMAVFLFSLIGLPPTAGFFAKLNIFMAAWDSEQSLYRVLALVMAVLAAVGAWYYLRIIAVMYLRDAVKPLTVRLPLLGLLVLWICALSLLWFFLRPSALWRESVDASRQGPPPAVGRQR
ncbi:MAG TPA: NADH-quinone oxidoreductase subunit N [Gemmatales bacterium]|nr:NADH-quinone oxidoreductase subunit N [Gemmatales bacterium]